MPTENAAPWPLGSILAGDQCHALPPKPYIQQFCLVRRDHVEHGHPHQNYGGLIWSDEGVIR